MMKKNRIGWVVGLVAIVAFLGVSAVFAEAEKEIVRADLQVFKVEVDSQGKESLGPGDVAKPGETLEYRTTYSNLTKEIVHNVEAKLPIPEGMEYLPGTAKPAEVKASLDGVKYESVPLMRKVKLPNGKEVEREVPYREYRSLLWRIGDIASEKAAVARARVRLIPIGGLVEAAPISRTGATE